MKINRDRINEIATRIAARSGVSIDQVIKAYQNAANGAAVNIDRLFIK